MKIDPNMESRLWSVLQDEGLADLSQYDRLGFFDEVPLFSRFEQVAFLESLTVARANRILLAFGLKVLNAIVAYDLSKKPFFAALTFWDEMAAPWLVPHLFVCCGEVKEKLRGELELLSVTSPLSLRLARWLNDIDAQDRFQIYEDRTTEPSVARVLIGHRRPMFPQMVSLESFVVEPKRRKTRPRAG
jgi:hypothetical protein